jgi:alcohol dehydrogenase class IV
VDKKIETYFSTSQKKRFFFPGKILWGEGSRSEIFSILGEVGSVDLIYDSCFSESDYLNSVIPYLGSRLRLSCPVVGSPSPQAVRRIISTFSHPPEVVVALGGGSTLDFAKGLIASWIYGDIAGIGVGNRRGISTIDSVSRPTFVALPTTAGSGAESSRYYVLYDEHTKSKVHGKSWELVADWILLDQSFLVNASPKLLLAGALDAFVHFLETLFCRGERSWIGESIAMDGITRILRALPIALQGRRESDSAQLQLLYCATLAGVAISNTRTGHIHEAGGALREHTNLSHAETLLVFLHSACEDYAPYVDSEFGSLWSSLAREMPAGSAPSGLIELAEWWEQIFRKFDASESVVSATRAISNDDTIREKIFLRVRDDRVWVEKESPLLLSDEVIQQFIIKSLHRWAM